MTAPCAPNEKSHTLASPVIAAVHIAVVATDTSGMKETGLGSLESCKAFYYTLKEKYPHATFHEITSRSSLGLVTQEAPDLVVLCSKYFLEKKSNTHIWFSDYFSEQGVPFTGSDRTALEFDSNKSKAKSVLQKVGIATAQYFLTYPDQYRTEDTLPLRFPVFIKPLDAANGNGVDENSIVREFESYRRKVNDLFSTFNAKVLVEELLPGREFTVAILESQDFGLRRIMPIEIIPPVNSRGDRVLGFEAKQQNEERLQAIEEPTLSLVTHFADKVFTALGARDFGRIDVMLNHLGEPHFLEANLVPGMTPGTSYFPRACSFPYSSGESSSSMTYSDVVFKIVELGLVRAQIDVAA